MKLLAAMTLMLGVSSGAVQGQGVLNFGNFGNGVGAPVSDWDGSRKLFGPTFVADLSWAPGIVTDSAVLAHLGQPAPFDTNGYFFGGIRTIPTVAAGATITCQVWAWDAPDGYSWIAPLPGLYPPSERLGWSGLFQVVLAADASAAPNLTGMMPFQLFPLIAPPQPQPVPLTITASASTLVFSWPSYWKGWTFALQESANGTNWVTLTNTPVLTGSQTRILYQIILPKPSGTLFYRLVQ